MKKLFLLAVAAVLFSCGNSNGVKNNSDGQDSVQSQKTEEKFFGKDLREYFQPDTARNCLTMWLPCEGGEVKISLLGSQAVPINDKVSHVTYEVEIVNNTPKTFFISDTGWKLIERESRVEVESEGEWDYDMRTTLPDTFWFTTVDAGVGKKAKVGYYMENDKKYLLLIDGHTRVGLTTKSQHLVKD